MYIQRGHPQRPSFFLRLLFLVPVDDVEESFLGVIRAQLVLRVVRPKRHGLLITLINEDEFALMCEVVVGVRGN